MIVSIEQITEYLGEPVGRIHGHGAALKINGNVLLVQDHLYVFRNGYHPDYFISKLQDQFYLHSLSSGGAESVWKISESQIPVLLLMGLGET